MASELDLARWLSGASRESETGSQRQGSPPGHTRTYSGTAVSASRDGTALVVLDGMEAGSPRREAVSVEVGAGTVELDDEPCEGSVEFLDADGYALPYGLNGRVFSCESPGTLSYEREAYDAGMELPCSPVVEAGDAVMVTSVNGVPFVTAAQGFGDRMASAVESASQAASEARAVAEATGQHFWEDSSGAHVTEAARGEWEEAHEGHNILINSFGLLIRKALASLVSITESATSFFDGLGDAAGNVVASFGRDGAVVGRAQGSHAEVRDDGFSVYNQNLMRVFHVDAAESVGEDAFFGVASGFLDELPGREYVHHIELGAPLASGCTITGTRIVVEVDGEPVSEAEFEGVDSASNVRLLTFSPSSSVVEDTASYVAYDGSGLELHVYLSASYSPPAGGAKVRLSGGYVFYRATVGTAPTGGLGVGLDTRAGQFVVGRWNSNVDQVGAPLDDVVFAVGNGTGPDDRSNAVYLTGDGNAAFTGSVSAAQMVDAGELRHGGIPVNLAIQCTGNMSANLALAAGTITQVRLGSAGSIRTAGDDGYGYTLSGYGIKVQFAGVYRVTASVYVRPSAVNAGCATGCYVKVGSAFGSATEVASELLANPSANYGSVSIAPKLLQLDANDIVFLAARCTAVSGTCEPRNVGTYLCLERIG